MSNCPIGSAACDLMRMGQLCWTRFGELPGLTRDFTDPFVGVWCHPRQCGRLSKEPFTHLENCLKGATGGLREMRGMGKSIERFIRHQLEPTLGESYASSLIRCGQIGHECYGRIGPRTTTARLDAAGAHSANPPATRICCTNASGGQRGGRMQRPPAMAVRAVICKS